MASVIVSDKRTVSWRTPCACVKTGYRSSPQNRASETSCIIDNFSRMSKHKICLSQKKARLKKRHTNAPFPIFAKKHICEAKMVANFKNAFLIFRKEIFIYRFF